MVWQRRGDLQEVTDGNLSIFAAFFREGHDASQLTLNVIWLGFMLAFTPLPIKFQNHKSTFQNAEFVNEFTQNPQERGGGRVREARGHAACSLQGRIDSDKHERQMCQQQSTCSYYKFKLGEERLMSWTFSLTAHGEFVHTPKQHHHGADYSTAWP